MKIRKQLALSIGAVVALIVCVGLGVTVTIATLSATGVHTDLSGRQRALSQRTAKESLLFVREPTSERADALRITLKVFTTSLDGMLRGGRVPRNANDTDYFEIAAVDDVEARLHGERQMELWLPLEAAARRLLESKGKDEAALGLIVQQNLAVFAAANAMTNRLAAHTAEKADLILIVQVLILLLSLGSASIALVIGGRIGSAIERLTEHADRISLGESTLPVPSSGPGEIGVLGKSLDRMRLSLNKAMALLEGPKVSG